MLVLPVVGGKKYEFGVAFSGIMSVPDLIKIHPAVLKFKKTAHYAFSLCMSIGKELKLLI
jgi:hypothetical protein